MDDANPKTNSESFFGPVLSIDYGLSRVGLARSYGTLADPLTILSNDEKLMENITRIISDHHIKQLIVGISDGEMAKKSTQFARLLEKNTGLPVHLYDETLSSKIVKKKQYELGLSRHKRQQPIDHLAAAGILQEWLDTRG